MNNDEQIMKKMQYCFPVTRHPLRSIAKKFGLNEQELLNKIRRWKSKGLIRYIGPVFATEKLGISSTLIAMHVDGTSLREVVSCINEYPQVTHNYLRDGDKYNLWFTLHARSRKELKALIKNIKTETGITNILDLPKIKIFKKRAVFS